MTTQDRVVAPPHGVSKANPLRTMMLRQETTLILVIVVIAAFTTWRNPAFLTSTNILEILKSSVIYFVMACGAAMLIIGGGLDFSIGAVFTLGALTSTSLMSHGQNVAFSVAVGLAAGAVVGAVNHVVITYLHVPPIIATLGTFFILGGIDSQITGGQDILSLPDDFQQLGQGSTFGLPNIVWFAIVTGLVFWFLLERTRFGINTRALGGNRAAATATGLRIHRLDLSLYVLTAVATSFAGIIYSARVGAGQVQAGGSSITLSVVTAVLIGGVSLFGGLGSITGVAVGAVLLSVIDNALIIASIPPQFNSIVIGSILIGAVAVDHLRRQHLYRKR